VADCVVETFLAQANQQNAPRFEYGLDYLSKATESLTKRFGDKVAELVKPKSQRHLVNAMRYAEEGVLVNLLDWLIDFNGVAKIGMIAEFDMSF